MDNLYNSALEPVPVHGQLELQSPATVIAWWWLVHLSHRFVESNLGLALLLGVLRSSRKAYQRFSSDLLQHWL